MYLSTTILVPRIRRGLQNNMHVLLNCTKDGLGLCFGRADSQSGIPTSPTHGTSRLPGNIIGSFMSTEYKGRRRGSYIVYDCSRTRLGSCGGWSDRLSGILTTFVIALLTNQTFLINHDKPCPLGDFLVPRQLDWRYNSSLLSGRTSVYRYLVDGMSKNLRNSISINQGLNSYFGKQNLQSSFSHDVYFLRVNWDLTREFRKRPNIYSEVPWIAKLSYADIYRELFNFLFKPSTLFIRELQAQNRTRRKIACAHVRISDNPNRPRNRSNLKVQLEILWKFMDDVDKDVYDIFIATNNYDVATKAKKRYPNNFIDNKGPIQHIDRPNDNSREGFLKQLLDFYTLTRCDILLIGKSGFGMTAAYLRNTEADLYCCHIKDRTSKACTRSTLEDVFPGYVLAPT